MKPSASRLLLLNGGPAYRRLGGIVAGVALGVAMLLILLGAFVNMPDRENRAAWMSADGSHSDWDDNDQRIPRIPTDATLLVATTADAFDGQLIEVITVATSASTTVDFPAGIPPLKAGEFYASPAMATLLESTPADQLADRWGEYRGEIPSNAVKGPSHKVVLVAGAWENVDALSNASLQNEFRPLAPSWESLTFRIVVAMGAIALLAPITLFISIVSALGAADRRERFATARLIGAGRRAIAAMSGAEMALASLVGACLGVGVAAAMRPLATQMSINGATTTHADLTPSWAWTMAVVLGIAALSGLTAFVRTFKDDVGSLGATREREERPVSAWRASLLTLGLLTFGGSTWGATAFPDHAELLSFVLIAGFAFIAFGIVLAGPWVTRIASQVVGATTSSAAGVVAAGRLQRHPRATFRSVAGLVVAVFVVSVFAGGSSAIALTAQPRDLPGRMHLTSVLAYVDTNADAQTISDAVAGMDGVRHVAIAWASPNPESYLPLMSPADARAIGAIDVPDAPAVSVDLFGMVWDNGPASGFTLTPPATADVSLEGLSATAIVVDTDGTVAAVERVKTAIQRVNDASLPPLTRTDMATRGLGGTNEELAVMAYLGMGLAIGISALALTVATAAAVLDRRRTFGLLRLSGMPVNQLRLTTVVEAVVPLAVTLLASAGLGWGVAWAVIEALSDDLAVAWPDQRYWWALAASIAVAAIALTSTFGAVRRSTELASTRFE